MLMLYEELLQWLHFLLLFFSQYRAVKADIEVIGVPDPYYKNQASLDVKWCMFLLSAAFCSDDGQDFTCPGKLTESISQPTGSKYRAKS